MAPKKQPEKRRYGNRPKLEFTDDELIEVIRGCGGCLSHAADKLGCSVRTIYNRLDANPSIKEVIREARNRMVDDAESVVRKAIRKNNLSAAYFVLKTLGRNRGYVERRETRVGGDKNAPPVATNLVAIDPDLLPIEARKAVLEQLRQKKAQENTNGQQNH